MAASTPLIFAVQRRFCSHWEWYQQDECFELDRRQSQAERTGELQLVLDPEFL
jgi:hypothetical protein